MKLCVDLGFHRKKRQFLEPTIQSEVEKRQFWACYYVDRDLALSLGRPPSISDRDIDVEVRSLRLKEVNLLSTYLAAIGCRRRVR